MSRLLLVLPQLPQDPSSGAARSMCSVCEILARAGWEVRVVATTATENDAPIAAPDFLRSLGYAVKVVPPNRTIYRHDRAVLEFSDDAGIAFRLLEKEKDRAFASEDRSQFNRLYQQALREFRPAIVYGYGGTAADVERYKRARAAGCKVVFGLHNHGYYSADWLRSLDAVLTPSAYLAAAYEKRIGLASTPLPPPLSLTDVVSAEREPIFFTVVNPTREKGAFFVARLAEELARRRPDLPMLFVESRGGAGMVIQAGVAGGFDLRRHESLMFSPAMPRPADIFRGTRVLLVPSVWEEPFGRVAAEALLNGVPPIVSDRGGLPEAANGGGFVLPLPESLTTETNSPVPAADVMPWLECMERLVDDAVYARESARAQAAGVAFSPETLAPRYIEFFERVLHQNAGPSTAISGA